MLKNNYPASLFIVSAPSGAGKSSLIKAYLDTTFNQARVAISHTTRPPRSREKEGQHYFFVDQQRFEEMINEDAFVEYASVFSSYYGTSHKEVNRYLKQGIDVLLDIDWQGAQQVRRLIPNAKSIFILPPSIKELERRLLQRGEDQSKTVKTRMKAAVSEMSHYLEYDYIIINDQFDQSVKQLSTIIDSQKLTVENQVSSNQHLLKSLGIAGN